MPLGSLPSLSSEPKPLNPFFDPTCAVCGKGGLNTTASKTRGASAGFCPSCGVFMCLAHTRAEGILGRKRPCSSCGNRLRTNTLLFYAIIISLSSLLAAPAFILVGLHDIQLGSEERAQMEMAFSDPGAMETGSTVKISGTVAGTRETPISTAYVSTEDNERTVWNTYDFDVNTSTGAIRVRGSLLSDISVWTRQIIGRDGHQGSYHKGDAIVVIGIASGNRSRPEIEPERIAPENSALYGGADVSGWMAVLLCSPVFPAAFISIWAFLSRYRSHRKRVWDFEAGASAMPLSSVEVLGAGAAVLRLPDAPLPDGDDLHNLERIIVSTEVLIKELENRQIEAGEPVNLLRLAKSFLRAKNYAKAMHYAKIAEERARALNR